MAEMQIQLHFFTRDGNEHVHISWLFFVEQLNDHTMFILHQLNNPAIA